PPSPPHPSLPVSAVDVYFFFDYDDVSDDDDDVSDDDDDGSDDDDDGSDDDDDREGGSSGGGGDIGKG
ncbi:MAG: hypothetical protein ACFB9M_13455, partial [Myxococcota bacterium]